MFCRHETKKQILESARKQLQYYSMTPAERQAYEEHMSAIMIQNDVIDAAKLEGIIEGKEKKNIENAKKMLALGISPDIIRQVTGLSLDEL